MTARITPYADGGEVGERVDEIVLSGDCHLEMLDGRTASLWIADHLFMVWADRNRQLHVALRHAPAPTTPAPVGDARGEG